MVSHTINACVNLAIDDDDDDDDDDGDDKGSEGCSTGWCGTSRESPAPPPF